MSDEQTPDTQPDELGALKTLTEEFIGKLRMIENEIETLKEDRKEVVEEYADKLDVKTLAMALRVVKIKASVKHKDTFDNFLEVLEGDES